MRDTTAAPPWRRRAAIAATAFTLIPVLVVVFGRAGRAYLPTQDFAVLDLRVRDVWSGDLPLVGVYSRFGWNHPGPLLFWLLAPLNWLFGGAPWTTLVGHAALEGIAIVGAAWTAWRRGGLAVVLGTMAVILLTYTAIGDYLLFQPWNPHVALIFFPWFVLAAWGVAVGDTRDVVIGAVLATFLVQAHVGYAPLVLACAFVALAFMVVDARAARSTRAEGDAGPWRRWRRPVIVAAVVTVVLWIPVVVDQLTQSPGNLRAMARYFLKGDRPSAGLAKGMGWLAAEYRGRPPWLGGGDLFDPFTFEAWPRSRLWLLIPLVLIVAAGVVSHRRRDTRAFRLVVMAAVLNGVGIATLAGVTGIGYAYLFYWRIPLAPFTLFAAGYALVRAIDPARVPAVRVVGYTVLAVTVAVAGVGFTKDVVDHPGLVNPLEPTVRAMTARLARDAGDQAVLVRVADVAARGLQGGICDALDRQGVDVRVDTDSEFQYGKSRGASLDEVASVWYVVEESALVSTLSAQPEAKVLARTTPLTRAEDAELTRLHLELADAARAAGRYDLVNRVSSPEVAYLFAGVPADPTTVARAQVLNRKVDRSGGCRCAVIAFPPTALPDFQPVAMP